MLQEKVLLLLKTTWKRILLTYCVFLWSFSFILGASIFYYKIDESKLMPKLISAHNLPEKCIIPTSCICCFILFTLLKLQVTSLDIRVLEIWISSSNFAYSVAAISRTWAEDFGWKRLNSHLLNHILLLLVLMLSRIL